ncbi:MAG: exodeoxyribonuclease V subunit beta [Deltaproteobacteria bacterium]|nr:exodeoxyribonuclease V subunit beta [Deltaproteobacteria bacterium]
MQRFDPLTVDLSRVNLIEASAGTGKTHSIATLFVRLLLEKPLRVDQILVVTFTRAATAELRDRLRARLRLVRAGLLGSDPGDDPGLQSYLRQRLQLGAREHDVRLLDDALRAFDTAAIHTIHGFCQRVLQENAFESGARFEATLAEDDALLRALVHEHWARRLYRGDLFLARHLRERGTDLAALLDLGKLVSTHRDARIVPAARAVELAPPIAAWRQARAAADAIWQQQRQTVVELLCRPGVLNAASYRPERIRSDWVAWLDHALAADSVAGLVDDKRGSILQRCAPDWLADKTNKKFKGHPPQHPFFDAAAALVARTRELLAALEAGRLALLRELAERVRDDLPRRKEEQGRWAFDDLVYQLRDALRRPGSALAGRIRDRYRVALIDEFQDTDPVQYEIFHTVWAGRDGLFLIGDPKQAIYSFRGADVYAYVRAVQQASDRATLPINHRSDQGLVAAVNALFGRCRRPFALDEIPFVEVEARHGCRVRGSNVAPFELLVVSSEEPVAKGQAWQGIAHSVAADMVALLDSDLQFDDGQGQTAPLGPGQLAVLCRTNRQAQGVQDALRQAGLPSVLQSGASVFDCAEALELQRLLAAVAEPGDLRAVRSALATRILGVTASRLLETAEDPAAWTGQVGRLQQLNEVWQRRGVLACLRGVLEDGLMQRWLGEVDGERRLTNLLHLAELAQQAAADRHLGPLALVQWLQRMRLDPAARAEEVGDSAQLRLESDDEAVQLVTVHRSKGLQYDVVYAPFLWDGALLHQSERWWRYHERDDGHQLVIDLDQDGGGKALAAVEALAESLRLLYVALTRARLLCRCVWGAFNEAGTSPLAYLLHGGGESDDLAAWIEAGAARTKALPGSLRGPLDELVEASRGAIAVREFSLGERAHLRRRERPARSRLAAAEPTRDPPPGYALSSYSSLIRERGRSARLEDDADRDRVAWPALDEPAPANGATIALLEVGGGARFGRLVHALLEQSDLSAVTAGELQTKLQRQPGADELLDDAGQASVARALAHMLDRPLDGVAPGFSLRQVTRDRSLVELPFQLAVRPAVFTAPRATAGVPAAALAELFERHASHAAVRSYAGQLRSAAISPPPGFLSGFIDLVFVHQGRWYVVDYKTNFLGPRVDDYAPARLEQAMRQHHYVLQYHLYALALDRYLRWRQQSGQPDLASYDFGRDFGGVLYLFVRGMCQNAPADAGVFFDRPPAPLINGLQALLDGQGRQP